MRLFILMILLVSSITSFAQTNTSALSVIISADETAFTDGLPITFNLTNTSSQPVRVLKWGTPLENGLNRDMFEVWQDDTRVPYTGRQVKRGNPQAQDFITLEPNETISQKLDIADEYAVYDAGDYSISFNSMLTIVKTEGDLALDSTAAVSLNGTDQLSLKSAAITSSLYIDRFEVLAKIAPEFSSCSDTQSNTLDEALTYSEIMAEESANALASAPEQQRLTADRYNHWFGIYDITRYNTVSDHFNKIHDALANRQISFDCDCNGNDANVVAFVRRIAPNRIHICDAFWTLSLTGNESMAGTIIHEISHFNKTGRTDDHAYGNRDAKNLAQTSPGQAVDNADNHQYFAENASPTLTMGNTQPPPDNTQPPPDNTQPPMDNTTQLNLNQPITAQIGPGEWFYYKVTGASSITLSGMTKDFDLFVKSDGLPSGFDYDCRPYLSGTTAETCQLSIAGTYLIGIRSYNHIGGGTFTLLAEGEEVLIPPPISSGTSPKKGLWWTGGADGNGFDIQVVGNQLTVAWYTYGEDSNPIWYLGDGNYSNNQGNAILRKYSRSLSGLISSEEIGNIQFDFADATHADISWSVNGELGNQTIEYFTVSDQIPVTNHTGLWYDPDNPGYGITVHEQGQIIATVVYYYLDGNPSWALGGNSNGYELNKYTGACPYCTPTVSTLDYRLGKIDVNFESTSKGSFTSSFNPMNSIDSGWNKSEVQRITNLTP
ncbi:MAG: M35 family metallo-endopeptidase [Methylococcales bacterium]